MPIETLTYDALAARLKVSPAAARSFAKRHRFPRSLSDSGKAVVSVDLAQIRHAPRPRGSRPADDLTLVAENAQLRAEIVRLEAMAAGHRADFERERDRADRLMAELFQATAEMTAAKEATARLEGSLQASDRAGGLNGGQASRLGHLAADLVKADRKACK